ncbi:MAG: hypothetical protein UT63_C0053G0002 [Candidatus Gottesmanbacteria bacterium GW2011_GWC2_39_8]|uniref:Uncharacterized protein n=1 Tax=Candidatus Gottesmanbacteria bacterium GW2011_GWC2_39_8 TaxID=1618450 RepID=A0A0G0Q3U5_9BACT|nr:MAG: hypothetical protein UT63_C0053G0002 [Candidatus Gottesmanbacteria bacterium GW2011_GWC2_39_8]
MKRTFPHKNLVLVALVLLIFFVVAGAAFGGPVKNGLGSGAAVQGASFNGDHINQVPALAMPQIEVPVDLAQQPKVLPAPAKNGLGTGQAFPGAAH